MALHRIRKPFGENALAAPVRYAEEAPDSELDLDRGCPPKEDRRSDAYTGYESAAKLGHIRDSDSPHRLAVAPSPARFVNPSSFHAASLLRHREPVFGFSSGYPGKSPELIPFWPEANLLGSITKYAEEPKSS